MSDRISPGAALFFVLLTVTVVTTVLVVRARTPDLVLEVTAGLPCSLDATRSNPGTVPISFFVRESDPSARVAIVDGRERVVQTLDPGVALDAYEEVTYVWDARTAAGRTVSPGRYRLLVELPAEDREMIWPRRIAIEAGPSERACGAGGDRA